MTVPLTPTLEPRKDFTKPTKDFECVDALDLICHGEGRYTATVHRSDRRSTVGSIRRAGGVVESQGVDGPYAQICFTIGEGDV